MTDDPLPPAAALYKRTVSEFLKAAIAATAKPEDRKALADALNEESKHHRSMLDGRGWISRSGWLEEAYRDEANMKRHSIPVVTAKGKLTWLHPISKWVKKKKEEILKRVKDGTHVDRLGYFWEIYYRRSDMQQTAAQGVFNKKPAESESGISNGTYVDIPDGKVDKPDTDTDREERMKRDNSDFA